MTNPSDVQDKLQRLLSAQQEEYGRLRTIAIQISQFSFVVAALLGIDSIKQSEDLNCWSVAALLNLGILLSVVVYISYLKPYVYRGDSTDAVVNWFKGTFNSEMTETILAKHLEFELKSNFKQLEGKYFAYRFLPGLFMLELILCLLGLFL
jgi:hypothetical protein